MMRFVLLAAFVLAGNACAATMTVLRYLDFAADGTSSPTRYLVTAHHVRMDTGEDDGDFTLFDRGSSTVYVVSPSERRIVVIPPSRLRVKPPEFWSVEVDVKKMANGGRRFAMTVNGETCMTVIAAPGYHRDANAALAALRVALAPTQAATWEATPSELRTDCELAVHALEVKREFAEGLPLAVRYSDGRRREFEQGQGVPGRPELFRLPRAYSRSRLGGAAGAR